MIEGKTSSDAGRKNVGFSLLFGAFMLVQLVILRLGNQAGRGYLPDEKQVFVYFFLQITVILGYLAHAVLWKLLRHTQGYLAAVLAVLGICCACAMIMLFAPADSAFYLIVTGICVFALGAVCGAVYLRMSAIGNSGARVGVCVGLGYSVAVALQYVLQLRWNFRIPQAVFLTLSFACLAVLFLRKDGRGELPAAEREEAAPRRTLVCAVVITVAMLIFTSYFNIYIHHLQVASGYTEYNAYAWPRLLMIPCVLLLGLLGDAKNGRLLPIGTLCVVVVSLLNTALLGRETYYLNMCLFYVAMAAVVSYYHQTFLRLAPGMRRPEVWAGMGRVLDSVSVILSFVLNLSAFPSAAVLALDIAALAVVIVAMAFSGAFLLPASAVPAAAPAEVRGLPADPFASIQAAYGFTPAELKVFRELVLTEDKQSVIGEHLSIKVRTVQANVTSIYRKTGVSTRAGLVQLYNENGSTD